MREDRPPTVAERARHASGGGRSLRIWSLAVCLFLFWLALSGHYSFFLVTVGAVTAIGCALLASYVRAADEEGHPIHLAPAALTYLPWLAVEIAKSAWSVTKVVLDPRLPISPTMTTVRARQRSTIGVAVYANSITLTPGTITVGVDGDELLVHALVEDGAIDLEGGGMDSRVSRFEGLA